jgi:hypothetical protein
VPHITQVPRQDLLRQRTAGRTLASLAAPLTRALHQVDTACMRSLAQAVSPHERACAALEVSLWGPLRRSLVAHSRETRDDGTSERIDVVLADTLLAFVDDVLQWVADVEAGETRKLARYHMCCRQLLGQLAALGGDPTQMRQLLDKAQLGPTPTPAACLAAEKQLVAVHGQLMALLRKHSPRNQPTLLDDLAEGPHNVQPGS